MYLYKTQTAAVCIRNKSFHIYYRSAYDRATESDKWIYFHYLHAGIVSADNAHNLLVTQLTDTRTDGTNMRANLFHLNEPPENAREHSLFREILLPN